MSVVNSVLDFDHYMCCSKVTFCVDDANKIVPIFLLTKVIIKCFLYLLQTSDT